MALIDMQERATFGGGMVTIPVARLPTAERINVKAPMSVVAYYSHGATSVEAVEALRAFLIQQAQRLLNDDLASLRPPARPGDPPSVLVDHEALGIS